MNPYSLPIYTINARDHVLLEVVRDSYGLGSDVMHRMIQRIHVATCNALQSKGIAYEYLRAGLVPRADKHEAAFIFHSHWINSSRYGHEVAKVILPLHDNRSTQSVLCGDLIGDDQQEIFAILNESLVLARSFTFVHGTDLFCVYANNLSDAALATWHEALSKYEPYVGYIPATFASRAKTYLSTILVNSYLQHKSTIIISHEDDRPDEENVNLIGYPFEDFGYRVVSLRSSYVGIFLGYKMTFPRFDGHLGYATFVAGCSFSNSAGDRFPR